MITVVSSLSMKKLTKSLTQNHILLVHIAVMIRELSKISMDLLEDSFQKEQIFQLNSVVIVSRMQKFIIVTES